jgi:hypothetical protein
MIFQYIQLKLAELPLRKGLACNDGPSTNLTALTCPLCMMQFVRAHEQQRRQL